jgi:hypothetical protein
MKKIISILVFSFIVNFISGHEINYEKLILRKWNIEHENRIVYGSFTLLREGKVFVEDASNNLISFPLASLSKQDQEFALHKSEWVQQLNNKKHYQEEETDTFNYFLNYKFGIIIAILIIINWFITSFTEKKKLKYLIPILVMGICMILYGFTTRVMKIMRTTPSPYFIDSAFVPFKPSVHTFWDSSYFYVESKGIPATHQMMVGISNHGWQQQVPIPQCYIGSNAWQIPLNPTFASNPIPVDSIHFTRGAIALAVNGIPIFNVHTNTGVDSYLDGQLDNYGGHCGRADDYHYHIAPLHLYGYTKATMPIAFGLDGYAIYGSVEPDGSAMQTLDANHGHLYNSDYHYHGTSTAPYMIARMAGQVTEDNTHQLIPQAAAKPVRPGLTPLNGALITACTPNSTNNGFNLTYTRLGITDSVTYSWTNTGQYTFKFYTNGNIDSTKIYNGFVQCAVPVKTGINEPKPIASDVLIYPNPNNGNFQLQLRNNTEAKDVKLISIYNLRGELVFQTKEFQTNIEIRNINKGIYLMQIEFRRNKLTKKLIVQ